MVYTEIGSFDAKTKLSELLREVGHGHRYTITLRGQPVADLIPTETLAQQNKYLAIKNMQDIKKIKGITSEIVVELIAEGRR